MNNNITKIFYGFLAGNLMAGISGNYDEKASAENYADAVKTALAEAYPGVEVEVDYQLNAEGCTPATLKNRVYFADGDIQSEGDRGEIETIEAIGAKVWESFSWAVEDPAIVAAKTNYKFTHNGFHGRHTITVRGPKQNPGTKFEISERTAKRISKICCGIDSCRCGEGHNLVEEGSEKRVGNRWVRRYYFIIPTGDEVRGSYPQS